MGITKLRHMMENIDHLLISAVTFTLDMTFLVLILQCEQNINLINVKRVFFHILIILNYLNEKHP